ncbi:hypothetical protein INT43_002338 [Umbelopsis isabellina]|uniref:IPT/TIG domain-containing protein n=1 Tax=Mortierella isabellina TaxID=91625 RepID=A0A8H7UJX4_MORIS|nr:hypothetical protein INT43_002338 [Umbelopsis isabellina]
MQQKHSSEETAPSTPEHSNTCDSPSSTSTSEPNEETDQLNLFFHTDTQDPFYNNNFMDMDPKIETMEADGFTTPIQSPSPPDTSSALSEQYKYATESISSEQQKSQQEAAFMDDSPNIDLGVQFNDILVQPHQPPATGTGEAASSGLWSGFNNFFSNVATNPFPQAIPNLAKNFTEYLSHYPQNLSSSLPALGASTSVSNTNGSGSTNENNSFEANSQLMVDGQSTDSQKLQIRVLGVPETGAKSRVETQIKLCMQLVTDKGEKVPLWSHLKLPEHMVARDKLKRSALMAAASGDGNNKIAITAMDGSVLSLNSSKLLHLDAKVICASDPSRKVKTCFGCIQRERRRSQRKKENKNKPDVEDTLDQSNLAFEESRVLLFNCSEIVDFSSGDTILPTRITCYCRHHDEKVGFRILFAMKDYNGNEIATGMSPPIMITDDHKSSKVKTGRKRPRTEYEHPVAPDVSALMRNTESPTMSNVAMSRSPTTPALSPAAEHAPNHYGMYNNIAPAMQRQHSPLAPNNLQKSTLLPVSTPSPKSEQLNILNTHHIKQERDLGFFPNFNQDFNIAETQIATTATPAAPSQNKSPLAAMDGLQMLQNQRPANHLLSPPPESRNQNRSAPRLHRLIPNEGPTYGGIEVTVLGSGFHDGLTCMFGDSPAIPTHCWSPNTLVCILPPSTTSGSVVVSFKEHPLVVEGQDVVLFTYFNESDRALMELALQVVGLKMTGKVEDAREIAMRIVQGGSTGGNSNLQSTANQQQHQHQQHSAAMSNSSESNQAVDLERQIIQVLDVMDTFDNGRKADLTLKNRSAQSMLHLAGMLGYTKLTRALLDLGCRIDALDRNGYTALHYASWFGHSAVAKLLLEHANANTNIRNATGSTPLDLARSAGHYQVISLLQPLSSNSMALLPVISSEEDGASSGAYAASSEMDSEFDYTTEDDTSSEDEVQNDIYVDEDGSIWLDGTSDSESDSDQATDDEDLYTRRGGNQVVNWLSTNPRRNRSLSNEVIDAIAVDYQPLIQSDDDEPVIQSLKQEPNWMQRTFTHLQQQASTPLNHMIKSPTEMLHSMPPMLTNLGFAPGNEVNDTSNKMGKTLTDHILAFPRPLMPNFAAIANMSMSMPSVFGGGSGAIPDPMMKSKNGEAEQTLAWYMALAYAMGAAKVKDENVFDTTDNDVAESSNRATSSRNVRKQHHSSSAFDELPTVPDADADHASYLNGLALIEEKKRRDRKLFVFWVPLLCLMVALLTFQFVSTHPSLAEWLVGLTDMKRVYLKF